MIYIFTLATNIYCKFFENFKNSINNFYPDKDKKLIVFSNSLQEYNKFQIQNTIIEVIDIPNILYTSIEMNKFNFILWYCKNNNIHDDEIVYYFDIDTYFYKNLEAQNLLLQEIKDKSNLVLFSNHPTNINNKYNDNDITFIVHGYINEFNDNGLQSSLYKDYSFVQNNLKNKDCIASFFVGSIKSIKLLNQIFNRYFKNILKFDRVLPLYFDEDIINYIWLQQLTNKISEQYVYVSENNFININKNEIDNINIFHDYLFENNSQIDVSNICNYFIVNQKYDIKDKSITKE